MDSIVQHPHSVLVVFKRYLVYQTLVFDVVVIGLEWLELILLFYALESIDLLLVDVLIVC